MVFIITKDGNLNFGSAEILSKLRTLDSEPKEDVRNRTWSILYMAIEKLKIIKNKILYVRKNREIEAKTTSSEIIFIALCAVIALVFVPVFQAGLILTFIVKIIYFLLGALAGMILIIFFT